MPILVYVRKREHIIAQTHIEQSFILMSYFVQY